MFLDWKLAKGFFGYLTMSKRLYQAARKRKAREQNAFKKDWGGRISVALVYPNLYSVGMANLGFLTVYSLLNQHADIVCERSFCPDIAEMEEMVRTGTRPFSLETLRPLSSFDIIAFSLSYENDYPNVVTLLTMAGIPAESSQRAYDFPLLIAGGPAAFLNPESMAGIIDVFLLGEAEEVLDEFLELYRQKKDRGRQRKELLHSLLPVDGIYVPAFYRPQYKEDGTLAAFEAMAGAPEKIERRWVKDLNRHTTAETIISPETEFPGIYLLEIGRGCRRRCRFCSTGNIYRPVRHRTLNTLKPALVTGLDKGLRLGLVCASFGDYPELKALFQWFSESGGRLAAPSLRLDTLTDQLLETLRTSGQKKVTLAPEAGSEKLRRALGKFFTNEDILNVIDRIAEHGIYGLRLYFMVGLPGEDEEDLEAIIKLTKSIRQRFLKRAKSSARMGEIKLSVNAFVPKPCSAFQWCAMAKEGDLKRRLKKIKTALQKEANITVTYGPVKAAYMQALFARGDRRVLSFILAGASSKSDWKRLSKTIKINPDFFVCREREKEELLPWDFIDHGVSKEVLYREYETSLNLTENQNKG